MKALIAVDKFKGSLSAAQAAAAIARALPARWEAELCPIADGGEGFVDALLAVTPGVRVAVETGDALGRECVAEYGLIDGGRTAVIEMSAASGLWRMDTPDVMRADTYGTGVMMRDASERFGVGKVLLGIGGSATNDGGAGMFRALGGRVLDAGGQEILTTADLVNAASIDAAKTIACPEIIVACDVTNPLLGETGATRIFGPQKGAGEEEMVALEAGLAALMQAAGGEENAQLPGAGAAGGLGWGLKQFCNAEMVGGFDMIAGALRLRERIANVDVVITGEGSLDEQTLDGKGPAGVARMAREAGKEVIGVAGRVTDEARPLFDRCISLADTGLPLETLMADAERILEAECRSKLES